MSEYNFKGIKPESIELLCLNRFNDSKEFYEEHKLELKEGITVPMRQIVLDLSGLMYDIDDKMLTDPVRSVSRIYRDTRGNRSKIKYRENMWLMLRRYKKEYPQLRFSTLNFILTVLDTAWLFGRGNNRHLKKFIISLLSIRAGG